jgi:hypothetical protein
LQNKHRPTGKGLPKPLHERSKKIYERHYEPQNKAETMRKGNARDSNSNRQERRYEGLKKLFM